MEKASMGVSDGKQLCQAPMSTYEAGSHGESVYGRFQWRAAMPIAHGQTR